MGRGATATVRILETSRNHWRELEGDGQRCRKVLKSICSGTLVFLLSPGVIYCPFSPPPSLLFFPLSAALMAISFSPSCCFDRKTVFNPSSRVRTLSVSQPWKKCAPCAICITFRTRINAISCVCCRFDCILFSCFCVCSLFSCPYAGISLHWPTIFNF